MVTEDVVFSTPFGSLVRFSKQVDADQPRVLILPGLAGHFATLVRDTVATMLPDHDVYVVDWHNARDVPVDAGRFGLDEFIEHVMVFLGEIGPGVHLVAVCQPSTRNSSRCSTSPRSSTSTPRARSSGTTIWREVNSAGAGDA